MFVVLHATITIYSGYTLFFRSNIHVSCYTFAYASTGSVVINRNVVIIFYLRNVK